MIIFVIRIMIFFNPVYLKLKLLFSSLNEKTGSEIEILVSQGLMSELGTSTSVSGSFEKHIKFIFKNVKLVKVLIKSLFNISQHQIGGHHQNNRTHRAQFAGLRGEFTEIAGDLLAATGQHLGENPGLNLGSSILKGGDQ